MSKVLPGVTRSHLLDEIKREPEWWERWQRMTITRLKCFNLDPLMDPNWKEERVALLTGRGRVVEITNRHPEPSEYFRVYRDQVDRIRGGDWLWAILHTHTYDSDASPSEVDLLSIPVGMLGVVLHTPTATSTVYRRGETILTVPGRRKA